ncbi:hypothetical protein ACIHFE_30035 [Streptomyces sp. NPDC052396]|uniref:hypothetical protein n=1 Tax=Streptomyces sp. NPDC052396 TaxID=3365689 RepID=UPI0037CE672F
MAPALLLAGMGVAACTLVTGPAAALLSGRGWAGADADPATTVIIAVTHGPQQAWTPGPLAWLFWTLTVLMWVLLGWAALWLWKRFGGPQHGGAQWGGARVERKLKVAEDPEKRRNQITAGRGLRTKKIVASRPNISATVFGVPGSSKTTGLVLPNVGDARIVTHHRRRCVRLTKRSSNRAAYSSSGPGAGGHGRRAVIFSPQHGG